MQDETIPEKGTSGETRRTFMKMGAAAGGAAAGLAKLEAVATTGIASAAAQESISVLVYSYQYLPETTFEIVSEISDDEEVLEEVGDNDDDDNDDGGIPNPDDWDSFVIRYDISDVPYHAFAFFEDDVGVNEGDEFELDRHANVFSSPTNTLDATVNGTEDDEPDE